MDPGILAALIVGGGLLGMILLVWCIYKWEGTVPTLFFVGMVVGFWYITKITIIESRQREAAIQKSEQAHQKWIEEQGK